jgi:hypothetical protein
MLALLSSAPQLSLTVGVPAVRAAPPVQPRVGPIKAISILDLLGGGPTADKGLIDPKDALPGREQKMMVPDRHYVLGNKMLDVPEGHKVAVFANGCFWGSEKGIWRLPGDGIYSTAVGYCAGFTPNPTYEEACSGRTGHTEGVKVVYDPEKISFVDILRWFWEVRTTTPPQALSSLSLALLLSCLLSPVSCSLVSCLLSLVSLLLRPTACTRSCLCALLARHMTPPREWARATTVARSTAAASTTLTTSRRR